MQLTDDPLHHSPTALLGHSDAELLTLWRAGTTSAGTVLLRRHEAPLQRFLARRVDEPCDLVQQTMLICTQSVDRIQDIQRFAAFLKGVAQRLWLEQLRKRRAHDARLTALSREPSSASICPSHAVCRREEDDALSRAIDGLPTEWKVTVTEYYWHGRSVAEIARRRGVATGTIKSWLARARAELRRRLARSAPFSSNAPAKEHA